MLKLRVSELLEDSSRLDPVMANELVMLDLTEADLPETEQIQKAVLLARQRSRKVSLYIEFDKLRASVRHRAFAAILERGETAQIHLKISLDVSSYNYLGVGHQSPELQRIFLDVEKLYYSFFKVAFVPCLEIPPTQIHHLGPLIALFPPTMLSQIILLPPAKRTEAAVMAYRQLFEYLRLRGVNKTWISFASFLPLHSLWNIQTYNTFAGPHIIHFDISNKCTHSCNFCGLYGNEAVENVKTLPMHARERVHKMMSSTLDFHKGLEVLETLPETVQSIQFGGVGDPCTHPRFLDFLKTARERAIPCEILSNMDYFEEEDILEMTRLGDKRWNALHFIANVSGSNEEMYLKTRPRQTKKNFDHVVRTLRRFTEERQQRDGHGVYFTLMCVMNKTNYTDAENYVRFAHELGAIRVFLKPMEVHIEHQTEFLIPEDLKTDYARCVRAALDTADSLGMEMMDRDMLLKTVEMHL